MNRCRNKQYYWCMLRLFDYAVAIYSMYITSNSLAFTEHCLCIHRNARNYLLNSWNEFAITSNYHGSIWSASLHNYFVYCMGTTFVAKNLSESICFSSSYSRFKLKQILERNFKEKKNVEHLLMYI